MFVRRVNLGIVGRSAVPIDDYLPSFSDACVAGLVELTAVCDVAFDRVRGIDSAVRRGQEQAVESTSHWTAGVAG